MKKLLVVAVVGLVLMGSSYSFAQFKSQVDRESRVSDGLVQPSPSLMFGWFNPEKFHMHHSFDLSFQSSAIGGMSLGTYTNSMMYEVADNLTARADLSLSFSPYNSFSKLGKTNDLSSLYLSRAEVNYKPWENVTLQVQYRQLPYGYYYSPYYNPWYREGGF